MGHAMGVAESKSGSGLVTPRLGPAEFFQRLHFTAVEDGGYSLCFCQNKASRCVPLYRDSQRCRKP